VIYLLFLGYLLATIIIECTAVLIIFRKKAYAYYCLLCNVLTNPALNLLLLVYVNYFGMRAYYPVLAVAEIAVVFIEAAVYNYLCRFGWLKSIMLSAFLNALSLSAGLIAEMVF